MKRKGGFYNYILVLPCVLLSCLTTVLFWLPPESPAKMVLGMNIFTSFFVLLLLLSKNVPSATDKIPLIGAYYCLNMVMIATSTCSCTAVVHIFFRGQGQVPFLIRKIFLEFLARIFCMVTPPVLPPPPPKTRQPKPNSSSAVLKLKQQQASTQPAHLITSVNNTSSQFNGNLMHQVLSRTPVLSTNHMSMQPMTSASFTALNSAEECVQLLNQAATQPNYMFGQLPQAPPYSLFTADGMHGTIGQPSYFNNSSLNRNSTGPYHYYLPQPQQPAQASSQHIHTQAQNSQLNNELNISFNLIENDIKEIRDYLRHTRKKLETSDAKSKQTNEWKQVALVLDRTLFFLYIIAIIVSIALMFPR